MGRTPAGRKSLQAGHELGTRSGRDGWGGSRQLVPLILLNVSTHNSTYLQAPRTGLARGRTHSCLGRTLQQKAKASRLEKAAGHRRLRRC